jgi:hypothetical protein
MDIFINKNGKIRSYRQPPDFHSSIIGKGFLNIIRDDSKDYPNNFNIERFSILSSNQSNITIQSPPDKTMSYHQASIIPEYLSDENSSPTIIISS